MPSAEKSRREHIFPQPWGRQLSASPCVLGCGKSPLRIHNQRFPSHEFGAHVYTIVSEAQIKLMKNVVQRCNSPGASQAEANTESPQTPLRLTAWIPAEAEVTAPLESPRGNHRHERSPENPGNRSLQQGRCGHLKAQGGTEHRGVEKERGGLTCRERSEVCKTVRV